ncbi:MAG: alpha/beta hydrolase [Halieaceae bacterium]|jgi:pimeloyl-ACP methyl ester carboxylesterase|nr:alpha/beta hydrolase [Halieaceae bacterium]
MSAPIIHDQPPAAPAPQPVRFPDLRGEWRIAREAARLALRAPQLLSAPGGDGRSVLLIPGWQAPEASMAPLRRLLKFKGYDARHWGEGINRGNVEAYVDKLAPRVEALAKQAGKPVGLVGWSLGGVIAREIARSVPAAVHTVVTYGSPVVGGPSYTVASRSYSAADRERINAAIAERERRLPIRTPIAAVFSRRDSIVSWPACIDRINPSVTHYEVDATHFSMGLDPSVWRVVLDQLAKGTPGESGAAARTSGSRRRAPAGAQS